METGSELAELKSCDRCLLNCARIFWDSLPQKAAGSEWTGKALSSSKKNVKKVAATKPKNLDSEYDDQKPSTSSNFFLTAGQLLETGPTGKSVFNLSQQVAKAPSLTPKRRYHVLNQSWRAVQMIEAEIDYLRSKILHPLMLQKIHSRQEEILQGTSEELKNAIGQISKKYQDRRTEVNSNCFLQMESLRRQLNADVDLEEKIAAQRTSETLAKRLEEIDNKLKHLGCTGPNFTIPPSEVSVQPSTLCRIELDNKFSTCMLPVPQRLVSCVRDSEKDELQNFLLYSRMGNRTDCSESSTRKRFKIEHVAANIDGLMEDLECESDDENT